MSIKLHSLNFFVKNLEVSLIETYNVFISIIKGSFYEK